MDQNHARSTHFISFCTLGCFFKNRKILFCPNLLISKKTSRAPSRSLSRKIKIQTKVQMHLHLPSQIKIAAKREGKPQHRKQYTWNRTKGAIFVNKFHNIFNRKPFFQSFPNSIEISPCSAKKAKIFSNRTTQRIKYYFNCYTTNFKIEIFHITFAKNSANCF